YAPPFGVIPSELADVYPLSQYECAYPPDYETILYVAEQTANYVEATKYERVIMLFEPNTWQEKTAELCDRICTEKRFNFKILNLNLLKASS
ncbi:MAG: hypothetical protein QXX08_05045, partial [Candidatus Bathyarchaeia archaeon]